MQLQYLTPNIRRTNGSYYVINHGQMNTNNTINNAMNNTNNQAVLFSRYGRNPNVAHNPREIIAPTINIINNAQNASTKKMKWGQPTWFLFHTLAEKLKIDASPSILRELVNLIILICNNLPCPDCANHASSYMNAINIDTIRTKTDLKNMLYQFHNSVNKRKNFPLFPYNDIDTKYSHAITINIIRDFMLHYEQKNFAIRMAANNFHRTRSIGIIKTWLNNNIQYFNL